MSYPYGICSDQHCHNWSAFSSVLPSGVNSRLDTTLDELWRCAQAVKAAGGTTLFFAGDLFHVRGKIDPEVFNPVHECIVRILIELGIKIVAIPGNHDLKGKESTELGSAITTFGKLAGFRVISEPMLVVPEPVVMVPWQASMTTLRTLISDEASMKKVERHNYDLIIHAPCAGAIAGLDGLDPEWLLDLGWKRIFAGHYHNHKRLARDHAQMRDVYSIGATTHQTWSDVGTKAGFLIVYEDRVEYSASHAPKFVQIDVTTEIDDIPLIVDGNYVRVKFDTLAEADVKRWRCELAAMGAKGVLVDAAAEAAVTRSGATISSGASLETSIGNHIDKLAHPRTSELGLECQDILSEARSGE